MKKSLVQCLIIWFVVCLNAAAAAASSQSMVESLPGYPGSLPFKLETGYVGVGENDEVQLFYYFVESENEPRTDPLILWLTGGPGCSGFSGLVYEIGPLTFDIANFDGSLPSFIINPYSWTKVGSIIFVDSPVGTGFSYANSSEAYHSSDSKSAQDIYTFLRKWLLIHPMFVKNRLYVAGDSYAGKIVPMVALHIAQGNEDGVEPQMSLKGYVIGNGAADGDEDTNERIPYAHRMALISDQLFEVARSSCGKDYVNPDPNNIQCLFALHIIQECTNNLYSAHILEPNCKFLSPKPSGSRLVHDDDPLDFLVLSKQGDMKCRVCNFFIFIGYFYKLSSSVVAICRTLTMRPLIYVWANDKSVRQSLGVREGTIGYWIRCNNSISYEQDVESVVQHHRLLSDRGFQALVYSGDHDMVVPYTSTLKWLRKLNLTIDEDWRPWNVDAQIAGYTQKYKNNQAYIIFATVKGAGHTAPEYKPRECLAMIKRWLSLYPL